MFKFVVPALVAGIIGSAALFGFAPASAAEANAQSTFAALKEGGVAIDYARGRGGFRGGGGRRAFGGGRGRGFGGGGFARRGGSYGGGGYGYRRGGVGAGAVIGGLAAGALIGGAIASQAAPSPVYAAPGGDAEAYCVQRFRSYDPGSGTYLGNDGERHPCP